MRSDERMESDGWRNAIIDASWRCWQLSDVFRDDESVLYGRQGNSSVVCSSPRWRGVDSNDGEGARREGNIWEMGLRREESLHVEYIDRAAPNATLANVLFEEPQIIEIANEGRVRVFGRLELECLGEELGVV